MRLSLCVVLRQMAYTHYIHAYDDFINVFVFSDSMK